MAPTSESMDVMGAGGTDLSLAVAFAGRGEAIHADVHHLVVPAHGLQRGDLSDHLRFGLSAQGCHDYTIWEATPAEAETCPDLWLRIERGDSLDRIRVLLDPDGMPRSAVDTTGSSFEMRARRAVAEILGEAPDSIRGPVQAGAPPGALVFEAESGSACSCSPVTATADLFEVKVHHVQPGGEEAP